MKKRKYIISVQLTDYTEITNELLDSCVKWGFTDTPLITSFSSDVMAELATYANSDLTAIFRTASLLSARDINFVVLDVATA